jgi:putative PIN family toxin of toxin-antitoxin system
MIALRLVLDTNVLVSAALKREGLQRTGFLLSITPPARLFVSAPILEEYGRVLVRRELGIGKGARLQLLQLIKNRSRLVAPQRRLEVTRDRDDNIFLECAEASRTDYLITGNLRLSRGTEAD